MLTTALLDARSRAPAPPIDPSLTGPSTVVGGQTAKARYTALWPIQGIDEGTPDSKSWLDAKLDEARQLPCDMPTDPDGLMRWMESNVEKVGDQYTAYLARRRAGGKREFFANRSQALYFLNGIAPTKYVDGAWLYSSLARWDDHRMTPLIQTYLEELGEGDPDQNHVVLYRKLMAESGADEHFALPDGYYEQGAIQLALAAHGFDHVPEMIGFNLGYEQLPLHLHISSYELNELGIDPYYFTVHVTVDNAGTGHARQAVRAVLDALPEGAARERFYERVRAGYLLNDLGVGSTQIARDFDLDRVMVEIMAAKSKYGRAAHADYCKVGGRTVNDWLADSRDIPAFLSALQDAKWIVRHQDPEKSRFWRLVQGPHAEMFGVFNAFELQVIYDWIAGDCKDYLPGPTIAGLPERTMAGGKHLSHRAQRRLMMARADHAAQSAQAAHVFNDRSPQGFDEDYDRPMSELHIALSGVQGVQERMNVLAAWMSPSRHHTPEGLYATRLYGQALHSA